MEVKGDKVKNPKTGRWVKKDGKIGKMLLKESDNKPRSTKLGNIVNHHDLGPIIKNHLDFKNAVALHKAQKLDKDLILKSFQLSYPYDNIPSIFQDFWESPRLAKMWQQGILGKYKGCPYLLAYGAQGVRKPETVYAIFMIKQGAVMTKVLLDIQKNLGNVYKYVKYDDKSLVESIWLEAFTHLMNVLKFKEAPKYLKAAQVSTEKELRYIIPSKFDDEKIEYPTKFNKADGFYYQKHPDFKSYMYIGGTAVDNGVTRIVDKLHVSISIDIPKKLEMEGRELKFKTNPFDITPYWSKAYNAFNTFLKGMSTEDKKKFMKVGFKVDDITAFDRMEIERYPVFILSK
jgi:hypothetical protein